VVVNFDSAAMIGGESTASLFPESLDSGMTTKAAIARRTPKAVAILHGYQKLRGKIALALFPSKNFQISEGVKLQFRVEGTTDFMDAADLRGFP
jgi:hypothetical protein